MFSIVDQIAARADGVGQPSFEMEAKDAATCFLNLSLQVGGEKLYLPTGIALESLEKALAVGKGIMPDIAGKASQKGMLASLVKQVRAWEQAAAAGETADTKITLSVSLRKVGKSSNTITDTPDIVVF